MLQMVHDVLEVTGADQEPIKRQLGKWQDYLARTSWIEVLSAHISIRSAKILGFG